MFPEPDRLVPGYRSRFGGLWPDQIDAERVLARKRATGDLDEQHVDLMRRWIHDGHVVIPNAVPERLLDALGADVEATWNGAHARAHVEFWEDGVQNIIPVQPGHKAKQAKLLDMHAYSPAVRDSILVQPAVDFLTALFERPPMAFQTLYFQRGTEQPIHQDTAYVLVDSPMELVGCWLALEDVREGSGELEYYIGSHKLEEHAWEGACKGMPPGHPDHEAWLQSLHTKSAQMKLVRTRFLPKRGDMLFWHADLAHGGTPVVRPELSRLSIVTHYCPLDRNPGYFRHHGHARRLPHGAGFYTYPCRWAPEAPDEVPPGV